MHEKFKWLIILSIALVISLPLSLKLFFPSAGIEIIFPAELLVGILGALFFFKMVKEKDFLRGERSFFVHPLTILIALYIVVNLVSALFSTMPLVSLKGLLVKFSYIFVFYFLFGFITRRDLNFFPKLFHVYGFALALVAAYSIFFMGRSGFNRSVAGFACCPFFNDHTIFAAAIAFISPLFIFSALFPREFKLQRSKWIVVIVICLLLLATLYFSFCRAAWVSAVVCLVFFVLVRIGAGFVTLISLLTGLALSVIIFKDPLIDSFKRNKVDGNIKDAGLYEQLFSLTNISNDVSNTERLNRWSCGYRMFLERPFVGFGQGTYQFKYLQYQVPHERTYLSMSNPIIQGAGTFNFTTTKGFSLPDNYKVIRGSGGTAHSEYFLELAESGIFSALLFLSFLFYGLFTGLRSLSRTKNKKIKLILLSAVLGLVTFYTHELFNNFLDDCKTAFLFWSSLSVIVSVDISLNADYHVPQ
jgi:putative inorganic carbon (hco3(-)) transporter